MKTIGELVDVMTIDEAAEFLGYKPITIKAGYTRMKLPRVLVGGKVHFLRADLVTWQRERQTCKVSHRGQ